MKSQAISVYRKPDAFSRSEAIGGRPLLLLGILLIVVGVQLFTIGLMSELIQRGRLRSEDDEAASRIERVIAG